ncbi:ring-cleaving dioxygenase [Arenibaculum pallidiluteum]|uniref:ring-cleaving dioxygenase n=1 Tax=Arenibaculum pallidiluteum TaxID=2812559 RepID=UPI001F3FC827|nr:ring-cleaving dioxygenase [Arenibaculum pallidiluteum]
MTMQLTGIHHLTAVTADAPGNHAFYTQTLGMRLVKKTVNQDDTSAYHLFYADGIAAPGTDITFFDWPVTPERRGTHSIVRTGLRVSGAGMLEWWHRRLAATGVVLGDIVERDGRPTLDFEDFEGQRLSLVLEDGGAESHPWHGSPVPAPCQIRGLGPVTISVPDAGPTDLVLTGVLGMRRVREYPTPGNAGSVTHVYEMGAGGPAAELHVAVEPGLPIAQPGAGGVHHVAFRIPDADYLAWAQRLNQLGIPSSGPVDRFYFRSLYFREPNGILFEIATDGPGFATDEPLDRLGEALSLPPFLEGRRREIEAGLKPL